MVLAEVGQKLHQAGYGEGAGAPAYQAGAVRLPYSQNLPGLRLRKTALFSGSVDLQR